MRARVVSVAGAALVIALLGSALAGASPPFKRYTFPAAPPAEVVSPGTLTVLLPARWSVKAGWPVRATDLAAGASWSVDAVSEPTGTTLADLRANGAWSGCRKGWGYEKLIRSTYLTLPVGRLWWSTMRVYRGKTCRSGAVGDINRYWLDRKMATRAGREVFLIFGGDCRTRGCETSNRELDAIMRSIRIRSDT